MNSGFGTGVIFSLKGVSSNVISGSVISFDYDKDADIKEVTNGSNEVQYVGITKRIKNANIEVLFTGSGSMLTLPDVGDTCTLTVPWTNDVSGSWAVIKPGTAGKPDDGVKCKFALKQWVFDNGTRLP